MSKPLSEADARAIALKLQAAAARVPRPRYDSGIEVAEVASAIECAGIVDVQETIVVRWKCPACGAGWQRVGRPGYGVLRSCARCHGRYFLRRPV